MVRYILLASLAGCYEPPRCALACTNDVGCPAGETCSHGVCVDPEAACPTSTIAIVIDNSASFSDLDSVPVLVSLGPTATYGAVADPATDLRFRDPATGADLPFDLDHWDPAGTAAAWVKVAHVPARSTDTRVEMTYGPDARGTADPASVWSAYEAVWHFTAGDRVVEAHDVHAAAVPGGTTWDAGQIGTGLRFGAADSRIDPAAAGALFDGWAAFTLELWIRADYGPSDPIDGALVIDKGGSLSIGRVFRAGADLLFQIDFHFTGHDEYLNTSVASQAWTHVVYTFDGRTLSLYRDGQLDGTAGHYTTAETMSPSTQGLYLGDDNQPLRGAIDEVRIARTAMSPDWIRAQYLDGLGVLATVER